MSQITSAPTFRVEDFTSQQAWIARLLQPLNVFMTSVVSTINGNVEFSSNITGVSTRIEIIASGADFPRRIAYPLTRSAADFKVCQALKNGAPTIVIVAWRQEAQEIVIEYALEVLASGRVQPFSIGARYELTLRAMP